MPCTEICGTTEIDIIFEFTQDFSDVIFQGDINATDINISVGEAPTFDIQVLTQGLEGAKGDTGAKGDRGEALVYSSLTPAEKSEVIAQFDSAVGATSYANIFLETYLS